MSYSGSYAYDAGEQIGIWIVTIYLIVLGVILLFSLISYIMRGIGLYTMAKRQGIDCPWLAFIPLAKEYLQGEVSGAITLKTKTIKNPGIWYLAFPFLIGAVNFVFYMLFWLVGFASIFTGMGMSYEYSMNNRQIINLVMGMIIVLVVWVIVLTIVSAIYQTLLVLIDRQIFRRYTTENMAIVHGVLSAIVPLYESICFLVMRNKPFQPGMEPEIKSQNFQPVPPVMPVSPVMAEPPVVPEAPVQTEEPVGQPTAVQTEEPVGQPTAPVQTEVPGEQPTMSETLVQENSDEAAAEEK